MSHILWRDATAEAPPDRATVLVWHLNEPLMAIYNATASHQKGCTLPNEYGRAVWSVDYRGHWSEGPTDIRWWAAIQDPDAQWASP